MKGSEFFPLTDKSQKKLKYTIRGSAWMFFNILALYILDYLYFHNVLIVLTDGTISITYIVNIVLFYCVNLSIMVVSLIFAIGWLIFLINYIIRTKQISVEYPVITYNKITIVSSALLILIGLTIIGFDIFLMVKVLT